MNENLSGLQRLPVTLLTVVDAGNFKKDFRSWDVLLPPTELEVEEGNSLAVSP